MANVCPTPAQSHDQSRREVIWNRCGQTDNMQADCEELVARRTEPNSTLSAPTQTPWAIQAPIPNTSTATTQRPIDSERLARISKEIN